MALSLAQQLMMLQNLPMLMRRELNPVMGINPQDYGPGAPPQGPGDSGGFGFGFGGPTDSSYFGGPPRQGHGQGYGLGAGGPLPPADLGPPLIQSRATSALQQAHIGGTGKIDDLIRLARRGHIQFNPGMTSIHVDPQYGRQDWGSTFVNVRDPNDPNKVTVSRIGPDDPRYWKDFGQLGPKQHQELLKALGQLSDIQDTRAARRDRVARSRVPQR